MASGAPRLNVALARLVDLKAALLAETRARGPDGPRMRSPQLARRSRDQLRRRMGQQRWRCARTCRWSRRRVRGLQSAAELGPTGRQLEARQRAGRRAASESTVVVPLTRRLRPSAVAVCRPEGPVSRLVRSPFFGDVTFFYTAPAPPRPAPPRSAPPRAGAATRGRRRAPCSLRLVACAVSPAPRCLCAAPPHAAAPRAAPPRRLRLAASASPPPPRRLRLAASASHRAASSVSPPRAAFCEDITLSVVCRGPLRPTGGSPALRTAYRKKVAVYD